MAFLYPTTRLSRALTMHCAPHRLIEKRGDDPPVTVETFQETLWSSAILIGWLALIPLLGGWHARRKFLSLLKGPADR
jgi:hypothetical protein